MVFHQCKFCGLSCPSLQALEQHEEICVKNGKSKKERFEAIKHQERKKKKK